MKAMKLVRLSTTVYNNVNARLSKFGFGNVSILSSYSTTKAAARDLCKDAWDESLRDLYRRINPLGNPKVSIVPVLDQWIQEGRTVSKQQLIALIKLMRSYRRFGHALEISFWMSDKRYFPLSSADIAIRLDLIAKAQGIELAENYFNSIPVRSKVLEVYSALLNCYARDKDVEKAEITMQKIRDLGFSMTPLTYNSLLNLYYQTGNHEKLNSLMHEIQEMGLCDRITSCILMSAYAAVSNVDEIDKILTRMESHPRNTADWSTYATAASAYAKAGQLDKALAMLKKSERLMTGNDISYQMLITQYGKYGKKDDVLRVWELYKKNIKAYNKGYICVISSMLNFDDLETAEKLFEEWESQNLHYDIRIPNFLIGAYSRKGLMQKAEALLNRTILRGGKPIFRTWYCMATGHLQVNQIQKGVEMMKKAVIICKSGWKPSKESLGACLEYFKCEGDKEGAEKFIKLLRGKEIISEDLEDKLLNYFHHSISSLDVEDDISDLISEEKDVKLEFTNFPKQS